MTVRVQVLLDPLERDRFRREAQRSGVSLSTWLREAGRARIEAAAQRRNLRTASDLDDFFAGCDAREEGTEPSWEEHLAVIAQARRSGLAEP